MFRLIKIMITLSLVLTFMICCTEKSSLPKKDSPAAVIFVAYVFEATMNGIYNQYPILPGETAIWTWETVVQSAEEYKNRLREVYTYQEYRLLQTLRTSFYFQNGEWKKGTSGEDTLSIEWITVEPSRYIIDERLSFLIKIDKKPFGEEHTVRIASKSGETTVIGTPWKKSDKSQNALFVAVTPFFLQMTKSSNYDEFISLYRNAALLTPDQLNKSHKHLFVWLNTFFSKQFNRKDLIDPNAIVPLDSSKQKFSNEPIFIPYDQPPEPIGGYMAIQNRLNYPEIAKKAGIEGRVMVSALIDEGGNVTQTRVMKSLDPEGCDRAAVAAITTIKWKPAIYQEKPVAVWIAIPIDFKLK